jgi:hypothetical protein
VEEPQAGALLGGQGLAVHGDRVGSRHVDGRALQHRAVEGHAAFGDQNLGIAARGDAGAGDHLGDAVLHRLLGFGLSLWALLAGAARTILRRAVEAAGAFIGTAAERLVAGTASAEGLLVAALEAAGALVIIPAAEGTITPFSTRTERLIAIAAAERLVPALTGLAGAFVLATGPEGALAAFAGLAKRPVARGGAATVGTSRRTAPAIIVVAVGHGSLIAEE